MHNFPKNVPVGQGRPFGEKYFIVIALNGVLPKFAARVQSIELESESPSFGIFVVSLEYVTAGSILPLIDGLLDSVGVQKLEECALASTQVSLHGDDRHYLIIMLSPAQL